MLDQKVDLHSSEVKPRGNSILVTYDAPSKEETSESGIVISQHRSSLERQTFGEVVQVGGDIDWINIGDQVVWAGTDGINLELKDGSFLILRETSILCKKQ